MRSYVEERYEDEPEESHVSLLVETILLLVLIVAVVVILSPPPVTG